MDGNDGDTKTAHLFSQQQNGKTTNKIEDGREGIRTHQRSMTTWEVALGETWSQGRYGPRCFFGACVVKVSILLAMNAHNPLPKLTKKINYWAMSTRVRLFVYTYVPIVMYYCIPMSLEYTLFLEDSQGHFGNHSHWTQMTCGHCNERWIVPH